METTQLYKIVRFRKSGNNKTVKKGVSLNDAKWWCSGPNARGNNWFYGFTKQ